MQEESVLDVLHTDLLLFEDHSDHIEPEGVSRPLKTRHPDLCGSAQLALLSPVHSSDRPAKGVRLPRLHFDERDRATRVVLLTSRNEIDVTMPVAESMLGDVPAVNL